MDNVLHPFINSFVIVYLDDPPIFNNSWQEHVSHVTQILETLRKNQMIATLKKCEFGKESLMYLRHMIIGGEMRVDLDKTATVNQWIICTILTEVRIFMGVVQCLRKFI